MTCGGNRYCALSGWLAWSGAVVAVLIFGAVALAFAPAGTAMVLFFVWMTRRQSDLLFSSYPASDRVESLP